MTKIEVVFDRRIDEPSVHNAIDNLSVDLGAYAIKWPDSYPGTVILILEDLDLTQNQIDRLRNKLSEMASSGPTPIDRSHKYTRSQLEAKIDDLESRISALEGN